MGMFDDMMHDVFGGSSSGSSLQQSSGGDLMDTLFGGYSTTGRVSDPSSGRSIMDGMFDGYRVDPPPAGGRESGGGLFGFGRRPEVGLGGYAEPILPAASQATGYGGQRYSSQAEADVSRCIEGDVTDPVTGYTGTVGEIYDAYLREGRDPSRLISYFDKKKWSR